MKDAFNAPLTIGDQVAFVYGASTNALQRGMITGLVTLRQTTTLIQIVVENLDGSTTTVQVHPAQVCKLSSPVTERQHDT